MRVRLISYTPNPEKVCAAAAQSCYSPQGGSRLYDNLTKDKIKAILSKIVEMGHHSVLEHASFTFSIEGVSRVLTHQLVRHRIASYSQQSQRYVKYAEPTYIVPHTINENQEALEVFNNALDTAWDAYLKLVERGIPPEDARFILPGASATNIVVTMNTRALWNFFTLRTCNRAQWEIHELAEKMLAEVKKVAPLLFENAGPACLRGPCPEGELSCGGYKNKKESSE